VKIVSKEIFFFLSVSANHYYWQLLEIQLH